MVYVQLEHRAMEMLLSGDEPALQNLRVQRERAKIVGREFTDRGFCTTFSVPPEVLLDSDQNRTFQLRDVEASVSGVRIEFVLSVKNGAISTLAAYTANLRSLARLARG